MKLKALALAGGGTVALLTGLGAVLPDDASPSRTSAEASAAAQPSTTPSRLAEPVSDASPSPTATRPVVSANPAADRPLLFAASGGDGDSWKDTQGREYRMGLVNTPEYDECFGSQATAKRKALVARGFHASVYTTDHYDRRVSVITLADGTNLNVWMARHGYANDTYLKTYRHENPSLARQLDAAFAAAKAEGAGLWSACRSGSPAVASGPGTTAPGSGSCHPDYATCVAVKGDGSGNGEENDLDCGDIGKKVQLRQRGVDPYRLDSDDDGYGCDSFG
jgi:endonuclease YncB( thermonuclease family)